MKRELCKINNKTYEINFEGYQGSGTNIVAKEKLMLTKQILEHVKANGINLGEEIALNIYERVLFQNFTGSKLQLTKDFDIINLDK